MTHLSPLRWIAPCLAFTLSCSTGGHHDGDPVGEPGRLQAPVQIVSDGKGKLEHLLAVLFGQATIAGQKLRVRAYGLQPPDRKDPTKTAPLVPGPTFVFRPGDLLKLHLHNYLNRSSNPYLNEFESKPQQEPGPGKADDIAEHVPHEISIPNNADLTNLHVHGLHVDPKQDNVILVIPPEDTDPAGFSIEIQRLIPTINRWWTRAYQYKIPKDHIPGTYWYHSHKHGSTSTQVENGMAGTLVMLPRNDADSIVPGLWNDDPEKTHDRVLVVQELANVEVIQGDGGGKGRKGGKRNGGGKGNGGGRGNGGGKGQGASGPFTADNLNNPVITVNGQYQPTLQLPVGQLERWRFVLAGANHRIASYIWVGKARVDSMTEELRTALGNIKSQDDAAKYLGGQPLPDNSNLTFSCLPLPGRVWLFALDGIPMRKAVAITPASPAFGAGGNRLELLVQADAAAEEGGWTVRQNYAPTLQELAAFDSELFGLRVDPDLATARYQVLIAASMQNGVSALTAFTDGKPAPNAMNTDPYALATRYDGLRKQWYSVDEDGKPLDHQASTPLPVGPLIAGRVDETGTLGPTISAQDFSPDSVGWQPMPDYPSPTLGPARVSAGVLFHLDVCGTPSGPTMPGERELNDRLTELSPASESSKLQRVDEHGHLVPGTPAYVAPFPDRVDGHQVAVFDRGQFVFRYTSPSTSQKLDFRQFWINGRQFSPDDSIGNPDADTLIRSPLGNLEPQLGQYVANGASEFWTHKTGTAESEIFITNPGYYVPITSAKVNGEGTESYNYDYSRAEPKLALSYATVTGLKGPEYPRLPVSTTSEEWLLINNSDIFHPFHIHISPFLVTEVGQLDYDASKAVGSQWSFRDLSKSETSPFGWVVGNWWDVILLPPHGYVKMRTWINVPSQLPVDTDDPDSELFVHDNANVYGSWVMHCHILRHEDRGMMTMVNSVPKATSLAGTWQDSSGARVVTDQHGQLRVTPSVPETKGGVSAPIGNFRQGIGNPFRTEPWAGAMTFDPTGTPRLTTFCVVRDLSEIVFSDGNRWSKFPIALVQSGPSGGTCIDLGGDWLDGAKNVTRVVQEGPDANGNYALTFRPESDTKVWWSHGRGSWRAGNQPLVKDANNKLGPQVSPVVAFLGTLELTSEHNRRNQALSFCVTTDGRTIVFGNGVRWTKK